MKKHQMKIGRLTPKRRGGDGNKLFENGSFEVKKVVFLKK